MSRKYTVTAAVVAALTAGLTTQFARADDPRRTTAPVDGESRDETKTDTHMAESQVHFEFDSAELSANGRTELGKAAQWIRTQKTGLILIEGHADKVGSEPYNKDLAQRRAEAARQYLLSQGVAMDQMKILSYGEGLPATQTDDASRLNRRIVLMAVQKEPIVNHDVLETKVFVDRLVEVPVAMSAPPRRSLGLQVLAGGGVTGFIDDHTNDVTDVGGTWSARVVGRTDHLIGYEAAYVGSAQGIDALGLDDNAVVMGNGLEADVRLNFVRGAFLQPYAFAGLGWTHYQVENTDLATASVEGDDNVLHLPVGAGVSMELMPRWILDVRGTLRGAADDGMFDGGTEEDDGLESLAATAQLGFAF